MIFRNVEKLQSFKSISQRFLGIFKIVDTEDSQDNYECQHRK